MLLYVEFDLLSVFFPVLSFLSVIRLVWSVAVRV
jgi:hypothetical protein